MSQSLPRRRKFRPLEEQLGIREDGFISIAKIPIESFPEANTTVEGLVMLDDSVTSSSTTTAATANAVSTTYSLATAALTATENLQPASTSVAGIVQLDDSVTSSSMTKAATANAVASAYSLANAALAATENLQPASTSVAGIVQLDDSVSSTSTTKAATANAVASAYSLANTALAATENLQPASTSVAGIVQLDDSVTSTSTTKAATANAVSMVYDAITDLASIPRPIAEVDGVATTELPLVVGATVISPNTSFQVHGDASILGNLFATNLTVTGNTTTIDTIATVTERFEVNNAGTGPALKVRQTGPQPIAQFEDAESGVAMLIADTGMVGIGTEMPTKPLHVVGDTRIDGNLVATGAVTAGSLVSTGAANVGTIFVTNAVTANSFVGNGAGLTGFTAEQIPTVDINSKTSGILSVNRGGTGVETSTGSGSVVLSTGPTLTGPALFSPNVNELLPYNNGEYIQFQSATTGINRWLRFRRGGAPASHSGTVLSSYDNSHWFNFNDGTALRWNYSTENNGAPLINTSARYMSLTTNGTLIATAFAGDGSLLTGLGPTITSSSGWTKSGANVTLATITDRVGIGAIPNANAVLTLSDTAQTARLVLSGREFFGSPTSTEGVAFLTGVNRSDNRQLWIGDSGRLTKNNTNGLIRIYPNVGLIDSIATDGVTSLPFTLGSTTSSTTVKGSSLVLDGGNVGIGTSMPLARLHMRGATVRSNVMHELYIGSSASGSIGLNWLLIAPVLTQTTGRPGVIVDGVFHFRRANSSAVNRTFNHVVKHSQGFDATSVRHQNNSDLYGVRPLFQVTDETNTTYWAFSCNYAENDSGDCDVYFTGNFYDESGKLPIPKLVDDQALTNFTEMDPQIYRISGNTVVSSTGNVGIGTSNPTSGLSLIRATEGDGGSFNGSGSACYIEQTTGWSSSQPWALFVKGYSYLNGFRINAQDNQRSLYKTTAGGQLGFAVLGNDPITFTQSDNVERLRIAAGGNVGIGVTAPNVQLHLSTDGARKLSTTTWLTGCDARIKNNIEAADLDRCYEIVKELPLRRFQWDTTKLPENALGDVHCVGWIAQEVKPLIPKAVTLSEEYGYSDFHALNADQIYKFMYGALQKAITKIEELETRLTQSSPTQAP